MLGIPGGDSFSLKGNASYRGDPAQTTSPAAIHRAPGISSPGGTFLGGSAYNEVTSAWEFDSFLFNSTLTPPRPSNRQRRAGKRIIVFPDRIGSDKPQWLLTSEPRLFSRDMHAVHHHLLWRGPRAMYYILANGILVVQSMRSGFAMLYIPSFREVVVCTTNSS